MFCIRFLVLCATVVLMQPCWAEETAGNDGKKLDALHAGFARIDMTPPVGSEVPGGFAKRHSKGVHDPLWAEAAVFIRDSVQIAVVGIDEIMVPDDVVADARKQAESRCGVPGENILVAASHTHNGGPIVDCLGSASDPVYCKSVAVQIADAIVEAAANAVPARVSVGVGHEDSVSFNRRFKMKDGSVKTHPGKMNPDIIEPEGPMDPDVTVIAVEDLEGTLMGCIVNHALHGTLIGGTLTSADWPYYLRKTIRGGVGADIGVVFVNGACGDITQVDNRNPRPSEFGEAWCRRVGMTIGAEALKVLARAEFTGDVPIRAAVEILHLAIRDLAESDEALLAREIPESGLGSGREEAYLREARLVREMKTKSPTVPCEVQAIRIGNAVLVANPTEFFCALGLAIKQASPLQPTLIAELANGYAGYCPTAEAFEGGGYEVRTARSSFLAPEAGQAIVDAGVRLATLLAED